MTFNPMDVEVDLVIWDFDGTMVDTEWPAFVAAKREYERYGRTIEVETWQQFLGSGIGDPWWAQLRDDVGGFNESEDEFLARYREYKNELTDTKDTLPGVRGLLDAFESQGRGLAVASSSPRSWLDRHLPRLGLVERFPVIVTRDNVGAERTKPHPDLFLLAAERSGVVPERCLVIEDSNHGVVAAKAAGMYVVAAPHRLSALQDFSQADRVVTSLEELLP